MSKVACYPIGRDAAAPIVWDAGLDLDLRGSAYGASERLSGRHAAGGIRGGCRAKDGRVRAALRKKGVSFPVDWGRGLCLIETHSGVLSSCRLILRGVRVSGLISPAAVASSR